MPLYNYKAVDKSGSIVQGEIKAASKKEALDELSKQGFLPIVVEESGSGEGRAALSTFYKVFSVFGGITTIDKILLARHLSVILKAGLGLAEALGIILADAKKPTVRKILEQAKSGVERGEPLSGVFADYPQYFSPVFVGLIKAGESSGTLDVALENLYNQLLRDYDLLKRVRMAMIYPLVLLVGSGGVIILMLTFVLPRMAKAFEGILQELPLITRIFIGISGYLSWSPTLTVSAFALIIVGGFYLSRSARGKKILFDFFEQLPVSSELIKKLALARFSRTLQNLLAGGVGAIEAIEISATTIGNPMYTESLLEINKDLKRGANLSDAFKSREDLYPSIFASIIMVGERTGTLEKSLETLSAFYDEEVDRLLKTLVALLEPLLIFIMGLVVAMVALAVLLPIFRLVRSFQ